MKPDHIYLANYIYIPLDILPLDGVKSVLTLVPSKMMDDGVPVTAYVEHEHHLQVPNHFMTVSKLCELAPVIDTRPTEFRTYPFDSCIEPRDHIQVKAMQALEASERGGILELACGKGKTVIALETIARLGTWSMIVVNTTSLMEQWKEAIYQFLGQEAGIIQQDKVEWRPITIAMLHTLSAERFQDTPELKEYGAVFFDECHHLAAPTFNIVCPMFHGKRFGLTATVQRADGLESLYQNHLGPTLFSDLTMQEIPTTYFIRTNYMLKKAVRANIERGGTVNQALLQGVLGRTPWRNALILDLIRRLHESGRKILVLGHLKAHLRLLHENFEGSALVLGEVPPAERSKLMDEAPVTFGTIKLAAEGLDCPALDTLVVVTPFSSKSLVQQALGRISRTLEGKQEPEAYFIEDRIKACTDMMVNVRYQMHAWEIDTILQSVSAEDREKYRELAESYPEPLTF